jgi:chromosomal replication initiation ATPase DnaA
MAAASRAKQLALNLDHRPALGRDDYLVAPCNEGAVAAIDRWLDWPVRIMAIVGPAGTGKSHLAQVWRQTTGAHLARAEELSKEQIPELLVAGCIVVEDGEKLNDEEALLHLLNLVGQEEAYLLITGQTAPGLWTVGLADLRSRLQAIPAIALGLPCDTLLKGVLIKLFGDRQLDVPDEVANFLVARMERSLDTARNIVHLIDQESIAQKRKVSRKLASEIVEKLYG